MAVRISPMPDAEVLRALLSYDTESGLLTWRPRPDAAKDWNTKYALTEAGSVKANGYRSISLNKRDFLVHRIVFKMMTGRDPEAEVDHRDGNPANNRWANLREADRAQNAQNCPTKRNNRLGFKGVVFHPQSGKYRASIQAGGVTHRLGLFDLPEDAHAAYREAAKRLHGEFARAA